MLLRELQNDKIKDEFSVYRQSTGPCVNAFMASGNVMQACKKHLARHAASYLEIMDNLSKYNNVHSSCIDLPIQTEDVLLIEKCDEQPFLSTHKESYAAYVAGCIE